MIPATEINRRRWRAVQIARDWKELLPSVVARLTGVALLMMIARAIGDLTAWAYRRVFTVDGQLRVATQHVLADLRDFCFARESAFDRDPLIMARRQGRRDVWLRISRYLELDEAAVQQLMEIDDGI